MWEVLWCGSEGVMFADEEVLDLVCDEQSGIVAFHTSSHLPGQLVLVDDGAGMYKGDADGFHYELSKVSDLLWMGSFNGGARGVGTFSLKRVL